MWQPFGSKMYSIGSSSVMMCSLPLEVHLFDQRGQRRGFAAADGSGDENQTILVTGQQLQALGQPELVHRPHLCIDDAEDEIDPETLPNDAGAKSAERVRVGKIRVAPFVELDLLAVGQEALGQGGGFIARQLFGVRPNRLKDSVQPPDRRRVHAKMNVRSAALLPEGEIFIDVPRLAVPVCAGCFRGVFGHGAIDRSSRRLPVCNFEQGPCHNKACRCRHPSV